MKTNIILAVGGFCMVVLPGITPSIAAEETKDYCKLEFWIAGEEEDVLIFDKSFTGSPWYKKSGCGLDSKTPQPDDRVKWTYICSQPNNKIISEGANSYEQVVSLEDNINRREERRKKHQGLLLHDRPLLASIEDPANVLAQADVGSSAVGFGVIAAACACGTSGMCSSGGMKCSKIHPSCPPC